MRFTLGTIASSFSRLLYGFVSDWWFDSGTYYLYNHYSSQAVFYVIIMPYLLSSFLLMFGNFSQVSPPSPLLLFALTA